MRPILKSKGAVVTLFWADWCGFCHRFMPAFDRVALERKGVEFAKVRIDEDENPLWEDYDIQVVPTVLFYKDGKVVQRLDGIRGLGLDEEMLRKALLS